MKIQATITFESLDELIAFQSRMDSDRAPEQIEDDLENRTRYDDGGIEGCRGYSVLPARVRNLFRKHHIHSMGDLHSVRDSGLINGWAACGAKCMKAIDEFVQMNMS